MDSSRDKKEAGQRRLVSARWRVRRPTNASSETATSVSSNTSFPATVAHLFYVVGDSFDFFVGDTFVPCYAEFVRVFEPGSRCYAWFVSPAVEFRFRVDTLPLGGRRAVRALRRRLSSCFSRRAALLASPAQLARTRAVRFVRASEGGPEPKSAERAPVCDNRFFSPRAVESLSGFEHAVVGTRLEAPASVWLREEGVRAWGSVSDLSARGERRAALSSRFLSAVTPWSPELPLQKPRAVVRPPTSVAPLVLQAAVAAPVLRTEVAFDSGALASVWGPRREESALGPGASGSGAGGFAALEASLAPSVRAPSGGGFAALEARTAALGSSGLLGGGCGAVGSRSFSSAQGTRVGSLSGECATREVSDVTVTVEPPADDSFTANRALPSFREVVRSSLGASDDGSGGLAAVGVPSSLRRRRGFACHKCGAQFSDALVLSTHTSGCPNHRCICGKPCRTHAQRQECVGRHFAGEPFPCPVCFSGSFRTFAELCAHVREAPCRRLELGRAS
ncbi:hypothetical protein [Colletotrichum fructicola chrysovirus 1]|uniref:Uncharacterized protein n=1 Tax=Colletotrichum fructicola chrysovirus 1 TaxID=2304034 RepID=A0A346IME3_9VIRU|nr:hypothetical protein [Colletotrichum fructicola chrysovirus 1]AXP19678.1 hypothetical protein [Colletotrichum fructicola chrysovirus 1]